jgi:hypothetical protein
LGLQHRSYSSSAGYLVPRSGLLGLQHRSYSSSAGSLSLEEFSRSSAPPYYSSVGCLIPQISISGCQSFSSYLSRNMVAINRFGCRMSNTKVSPQLATLDGPVFISSALCRENFCAYGMKKCTDGCIGCLAITGLQLDKSNAA